MAGNTVRAAVPGALNLQINPPGQRLHDQRRLYDRRREFHASLQQIINKRFTIESGSSIQWTGSPMNALLDIDAVYKVKARCSRRCRARRRIWAGTVRFRWSV